MKLPFVIDVRPVRRETISPKEYLRLAAEQPTLIARAEFLPPRTGEIGFGSFDVHYTRPRHRLLANG